MNTKQAYKTVRILLLQDDYDFIMLNKKKTGLSLNHFVRIAIYERKEKLCKLPINRF